MRGFPAPVVVDSNDHCDSCGEEGRQRRAASYGANKPVLCQSCLLRGLRALGVVIIVHHLHHGVTPCVMTGIPGSWPPGHFWSEHWEDVSDCEPCLKARPS